MSADICFYSGLNSGVMASGVASNNEFLVLLLLVGINDRGAMPCHSQEMVILR